ncbi:hypothetical protein ACTI_83530 [Actinoplanes sp. OR16]|uniref:hypothetical protein n=1 Tax=Actinoplanes sp. OR16 TaxID=946334 RepID=UPI000F6FF046|nr:hypothetical protein [Actinoplanes sp. OR16]BBH71668.1 hypothetical protein ACTI_83530 [Actinoplanes sp. OR16]
MTYSMVLLGGLNLPRLRAALAALAGVPEDEVDISDRDAADRNWEAAVLCTYEPVGGDVSWSLDIYLRDADPGEKELGEQLAASLGEPVLYSAQDFPPSAHWLVEPDGSRMRARVYDGEDEETLSLRIDAVERPVGFLPDVRVEAQPEVIREHRMATPITDGLRGLLGDAAKAVLDGLGAWEALTVRMTSGWPPDGWYPLEYWNEDLGYRDELEADIRRLPESLAAAVSTAVGLVDETFRAATREIGGVGPGKGWWWRRVPEPVPWRGVL